jgi:hypothetical protein
MTTILRCGISLGFTGILVTSSLAALSVGGTARAAALAQASSTPVNPSAKTMAAFKQRVDEYMSLQKKLASEGPRLPNESTPEQIDKHQRELAVRLAAARSTARVGHFFDAEMQALVHQVMAKIFSSPTRRREFREAVMEENPRGVKLTINQRYPDQVPMATMPPELLEQLPALPGELEYRFVGESLILLDTVAHVIIDYMPRALPAA